MEAAGLPAAFTHAVCAGPPLSQDAITSIPSTLSALCLNSGGMDLVKQSGALKCIIPFFSTQEYIKVLRGKAKQPRTAVLAYNWEAKHLLQGLPADSVFMFFCLQLMVLLLWGWRWKR